eukprot:jgi/Astpho2/4825/Aster-07523
MPFCNTDCSACFSVMLQVLVNGKYHRTSTLSVTWITNQDELMMHITVRETLTHMARLQIKDTGTGNISSVVHDVAQQLGLLSSLDKMSHELSVGNKRRLCVATQLINCTPLLVLHDIMVGMNEGDSLAIMRCVSEYCKMGCTAIVEAEQPSTDVCSFFDRAYILAQGELVFFGSTGHDAVQLLTSAGMPCPPLYSPVEQFMRLIDPTFEVYLQTAPGGAEEGWTANFSSMMTKLLQESYDGSKVQREAQLRTEALATLTEVPGLPPLPDLPPKKALSRNLQGKLIQMRCLIQSLRSFSMFQSRLLLIILITLVYGGTYWKPDHTYRQAWLLCLESISCQNPLPKRGLEYRLTVLFLASCVLPSLAVLALPVYASNHKVFVRERDTCRECPYAFLSSTVFTSLPYLLVAACLTAIVLIPMAGLNSSGAAWGYFILCTWLTYLIADAIVLLISLHVKREHMSLAVALGLFGIQIFSCGYFFGSQRGLQLAVGTLAFSSYAYRGLVKNELTSSAPWGCPQGRYSDILQASGCPQLTSPQAYSGISQDFGVVVGSRWDSIYVLLGMLVVWRLLHAGSLLYRIRAVL